MNGRDLVGKGHACRPHQETRDATLNIGVEAKHTSAYHPSSLHGSQGVGGLTRKKTM